MNKVLIILVIGFSAFASAEKYDSSYKITWNESETVVR